MKRVAHEISMLCHLLMLKISHSHFFVSVVEVSALWHFYTYLLECRTMLLLMLANRLATCDHGSGKYDLSLALRLFIILTGQSLQIAKYFIPIVERYIDFKLSVVIFYLH